MGLFYRRIKKRKPSAELRFFRHTLSFEALEPRLLLSADAFGGAIDADDINHDLPLLSNYDKIREELDSKLLLPTMPSLALTSNSRPTASDAATGWDTAMQLNLTKIGDMLSPNTADSAPVITQLLFVDSETEDLDLLLNDLVDADTTKIVSLAANEHTLEAMTAELEQHRDLQSVHIISHGSSGNLHLGDSTFNLTFLQESSNQQLLGRWQSAMAEDADLLIYGCDYASGETGQQALSLLAQLTAMDIAASNDRTGGAALGGDWQLETTIGQISTAPIIGLDAQQTWGHALATIVVNSSADDGLAFGTNNVTQLLANETEISLREAIQAVNNDGMFSSVVHQIVFDLEGDHTINLATQLPTLQRAVIIDGRSEPDYVDQPVVTITGGGTLLQLSGNNIEIHGLELSGGNNGLVISGNNNIVDSSFILNNLNLGINIIGGNNLIGGDQPELRNIISGNGGGGIHVGFFTANGNQILGNWIGLGSDGESAQGNGGSGILVNASQNTQIGGTTGTAGNVISGNAGHGIEIVPANSTPTGNHLILGNIVGLNAAGDRAVGNDLNGIELFNAQYIEVGDGSVAGRNIVSGNGQHGIIIIGTNADAINVLGNFIGTDRLGLSALGNGYNGIEIYGGPSTGAVSNQWDPDDPLRVVIGGAESGDGNVISGNSGDGIKVDKRARFVGIVGNWIGTDVTGNSPLGNGGNGITVISGADSTTTNAQTFIQQNTLAYNRSNGVSVEDPNTQGVYIRENRIYANDGVGVDLDGDGLTANDAGDLDSGANRLLNFPVINSVGIIDNQLRIQGFIEYNAIALGQMVVEFFYAEEQNTNGAAYATHFIGAYTFSASASGINHFGQNFTIDIPSGAYITATATSLSSVGTSEIAPAIPLTQGNIVNQLALGTVTLSGEFIQGAILAASHAITDGNGISNPIQWQWRRNGIAIADTNSDTYSLTEEDVGQSISVSAFFVDDAGYAENIDSAASQAIANVNDPASGTVTIDGSRQEDAMLTVNYSLSDGDGLPQQFTLQWYRDGIAIDGAVSQSYRLQDADVGRTISAGVSFIDLHGSPEQRFSNATVAIANVNDLPSGDVIIQGILAEDSTLTVQINLADADGLPSEFQIQWYRDGTSIAGANNSSYTLGDQDVGAVIRVGASYQDLWGATEIVYSSNSGQVSNINDAPLGTLHIIGSNLEGNTLVAQANFTDADGITNPISYQWYRDGNPIGGANSAQYSVINADVGSQLQVRASYQDDGGFVETLASSLTGVVNNTNQTPEGTVVILGVPQEDQLLSAEINLSDADGLPASFSYRWYRDGVAIIDADQSSYLLTDADVAAVINLDVSYIDNLGSNESVSSAITAAVTNINDNPTGNVLIVGTNIEGQILSAQANLADDDGIPANFSYQWLRDGQIIVGANSGNYQLGDLDIGSRLQVEVTYTDLWGTAETRQSAEFGPVLNLNQSPVGSLNIIGTAEENQLLTTQFDFTDDDGLPSEYSYQWYRNGATINGATSNQYLLTDNDVNSQISVALHYVDLRGSEENLVSTTTAMVVNINDLPSGTLQIIGTAREGQRLTVNNSISDGDGIETSLGYQWYRDGLAITGATDGQYILRNTDVNSNITLAWQYQDRFGQIETVVSQALGSIANVNSLPAGTVGIAGAATEDQLLIATHNLVDGDGLSGGYSYQWYRDGFIIGGAQSSSLALGDLDVNTTVQVVVSYVDDFGTLESVASAGLGPVQAINDRPVGSVQILGQAEENPILRAQYAIADDDGFSGNVTFQWYRNFVAIAGADGATWQLTSADIGARISVSVSYTDDQGTDEKLLSQPFEIWAPLLAPPAEFLTATDIAITPEQRPEPTKDIHDSAPEAADETAEPEPHARQQDYELVTGKRYQPHTMQERLGGLTKETAIGNGTYYFISEVNVTPNNHNAFDLKIAKAIDWSLPEFNSPGGLQGKAFDFISILKEPNFNDRLDGSVQALQNNSITLPGAIVGGTTALSTGVSVGYLIWTLRSGMLMTSLLSSLPAWRFIDPLPILESEIEQEEDEESLQSIVDESNLNGGDRSHV